MHVPEHILEDIRSRNDIVDVIGEHVRLQKRGKNFLGLCPFHHEKTPSFNVNPDLGIYKCFGCGKSGNVFTFLMQHNGMVFPDAVKFLAKRAGITLEEEEQSSEQREKQSRADGAYKALAAAVEFYTTQLTKKTGIKARSYFQKRGFNDEMLKVFALGFSPDDWQQTTNELIKQNFTRQMLEDAGLVISKDDGTFHDRFRGRTMFPIHDAMGRIVGFGARLLGDEKDQAKYVNSPQSLVYDKSKVLYGLFQAKQAIRQQDKAILTEGYADTITLHQFGFHNTVASSGTALTKEQLQLLARYTRNLVVVYDGDDAGLNAALRGVELALEEGFDISIVTLPNKEDPDTFVRSHGEDTFRAYLNDATSFIDFVAERYRVKGLFTTPKGQAEAVRGLMRLIAHVRDTLQKEFLIRNLAQKFSLREEVLYAELKGNRSTDYKSGSTALVTRSSVIQNDKAKSAELNKPQSILSEERALLRLALTSQEAFRSMESAHGISRDTFVNELAKNIFQAIEHAFHNGVEVASLLTDSQSLNDEEKKVIADLLFAEEQPSLNWSKFNVEIFATDAEKIIVDALLRLRLSTVLAEMNRLRAMLKENPEDETTLRRFDEVGKLRNELEREKRQLKAEIEDEG